MLTSSTLRRGATYYADLATNLEIPVRSVHAPLRWRSTTVQQEIDDARRSIAFAAEIPTCDAVVVHLPHSHEQDRGRLRTWLEALRDIWEAEGRNDLQFSLENRPDNHDGTPPQPLDDIDLLRRVASEWDFGITFDVAHAVSMGLDPIVSLRRNLAHVTNIHISDAANRSFKGGLLNGLFRDHQLPGRGMLPITEIINMLARERYQGLVTIELNPLTLASWCPPLALRRMRHAVHVVKDEIGMARYLAENASPRSHRHAR
jgi:sugar phosphate isomerase/epimerase